MGQLVADNLTNLLIGIQPFFDFMQSLWSAFPLAFRWVFALFFGAAITFSVIRNFIL